MTIYNCTMVQDLVADIEINLKTGNKLPWTN